jgi:hypothetical protein
MHELIFASKAKRNTAMAFFYEIRSGCPSLRSSKAGGPGFVVEVGRVAQAFGFEAWGFSSLGFAPSPLPPPVQIKIRGRIEQPRR